MSRFDQLLLAAITFLFIACQNTPPKADYQVIPLPQEITLSKERPFVMNEKTVIFYPADNALLQQNAAFLAAYIKEATGKEPTVEVLSHTTPANCIILNLNNTIHHKEGYELLVKPEYVMITAPTEAGVFYGIQTLRKSIPITTNHTSIELPAATVKDYPRFSYRGMMLDVCRHFFPVEFIKRYIDILALHHINHFHWHLTDDQGWRIEIKKYPKLAEIASQRKETVIGRNSGKYDGTAYGGYYTQEEIKEIIAYAQDRYITIIPEIDLPGHMLAALTAYPAFGCTGGPYEVATSWGVFKDVICLGNDQALLFLEDILDEVTDLFPSKFIHIGGDEAPRDRWKTCAKCQARIKTEGLRADQSHTAEDHLQSYCMKRMERFLAAKGREVIGWDEILEGNVAPNATVMSWRGTEGGIAAARLKHNVIMVPDNYAYFDYYQTDDLTEEPSGIGGFVSVEKVYSFEPIPAKLTEEEKSFIIGNQANLWTEYIATPEHAEYMVLPRIAALAETQWTLPEKKNYQAFKNRLLHLMDIYEQQGYNYAKHLFNIQATYTPQPSQYTPQPTQKTVQASLSTLGESTIYYTLDGSEPDASSDTYYKPLLLTESTVLKALTIREKEGKSKTYTENINFNKATLCSIELMTEPAEKFKFNDAITLVDGLKGSDSPASGKWIGFYGTDMEAIIDLKNTTEITRVSTQANIDVYAWIMGATEMTVSVSDNHKDFKEVGSLQYPEATDIALKSIDSYKIEFEPVKAKYVKIVLKPSKGMPKGHRGEGRTPYLLVDEITIE